MNDEFKELGKRNGYMVESNLECLTPHFLHILWGRYDIRKFYYCLQLWIVIKLLKFYVVSFLWKINP